MTLMNCYCFFSGGAGRTGVFIALSVVLERLRFEGVVDLYQVVKILRQQRSAMVQTDVSRHIHNTFSS